MATPLADRIDAESEPLDERGGLRERQRLARGKAILDAAFALMVERGYEALTMEAVAARVGISRQTLYHHFSSRDEIVLQALLILMDEGLAMIASLDALPSLTPLDRLQRIVRWMVESKSEPVRAALVKVKQSLTTILSHPEYEAAAERRNALLARIVTEAQESGALRADLPDRMIVRMLLNVVTAAGHPGDPPQLAGATLEVFFAGLRS